MNRYYRLLLLLSAMAIAGCSTPSTTPAGYHDEVTTNGAVIVTVRGQVP